MSFETGANTRFYIGTTANAATQAEYEADTYQEVDNIESIPAFGDESNSVTFTALKDGRVQKKKGTRDAGDLDVPMAFTEADVGQVALATAEASISSDDYNFKVEYSNGAVRYFRGQVSSFRETPGGADDVLMLNCNILINSAILRVAAP